jgi:hypothetical protein
MKYISSNMGPALVCGYHRNNGILLFFTTPREKAWDIMELCAFGMGNSFGAKSGINFAGIHFWFF